MSILITSLTIGTSSRLIDLLKTIFFVGLKLKHYVSIKESRYEANGP